jgi:inorganic triphosphatase YgiF
VPIEIELKLIAEPSDLPKVRRALLDLAPRSVSDAFLTTTYYDTADRALRRRGLSLRVRETNGRFVQTIKADGKAEADVLTRGEWEDEIASALPDIRAPVSGSKLPEGIVVADDLRPLFVTSVKRTTMTLERSPSLRIEALHGRAAR